MFDKNYSSVALQARAKTRSCNLCVLLWNTCQSQQTSSSPTVFLERIGSSLRINGSNSMALSIFRDPGNDHISGAITAVLLVLYRMQGSLTGIFVRQNSTRELTKPSR
jgi:hypothetical protein